MEITSKQKSIIIGSLLGDGSIIPKKYGHCYFSKGQTHTNKPYLEWLASELQPFSCPLATYDNHCNGKTYKAARLYTKALAIFDPIRSEWYPNGKKIVPTTISLDPISLAIWFFDDGYNNVDDRQCTFATNGFIREECEFLCDRLNELDIKSYVKNTVNVLVVRAESYKQLIDLIKPYMLWDCLSRKIQYRESKQISDSQALDIFNMYEAGYTQKEIGLKMGRSPQAISNILRGKTKHKERLRSSD